MPQKRPRAEAIDALTDLGEALITVRVCTNLMKEFGDGSEDDSATTTDEDIRSDTTTDNNAIKLLTPAVLAVTMILLNQILPWYWNCERSCKIGGTYKSAPNTLEGPTCFPSSFQNSVRRASSRSTG